MLIDILLVLLIAIFVVAAFFFTVLPLIIPGIILTIIAAVIFILWKGLAALGVINLIIILAMGLIYLLIDWLGEIFGAKKFGGSKHGAWGAIIGGLAGIPLGGLIGVFIGTILGAAIFEIIFDRAKIKNALRVGAGAGLGFILGSFGKIIAVAVATAAFLWGIWK